MAKLRILVTGGSGMVGSNLLEHPYIESFEVLAPSSSELDLRNFRLVRSLMSDYRPDMVIHAAGKVGGIQANMREPVKFLLDNLDIGRNTVWAARQAKVKRLLNLGSSCMYPRNHDQPLTEEMLLKGELEPTNEGYALAKAVTVRLCEYISRENAEFQYKTLIPCNLYGRHDKFDPTNSHLIPAIIHKIHQAKNCGDTNVEIWGDGKARREFMYAGDFADALVQAVLRFDTLPALMNIGLGYDYTINQYYAAVSDVLGYCGGFTHDFSRPVGMSRKLINVEKQKLWGWSAHHTLYDGIKYTYSYYLKEYLS